MTGLREKIGQMFLIGCEGETLSKDERLIAEAYSFGGFILFGRNCREPKQIVSLCRSLWNSANEIPPFIAVDQEGGRVHRLPQPFSHFPAAMEIGTKDSPGRAYQFGRATAQQLKLVGVNLNFAPVLDVNSNPANPIIGDRAFGFDPQRVIDLSSAWARGLRDGGIIPCGKHFPGHGDTEKDSHLELPTVNKSAEELKAVELLPFADACRNRIESLMTAHVLYPAFDPKLPATLSETILTGLLRHQLGYDGVVFSDDLEMKAISDNYPVEQTASLAVHAGIDVLLCCHAQEKAIKAFEFLCDEADRNSALRAQIENSVRRISELKRRYVKNFTGVKESEILARLAEWKHQRLIDEFYGNL